MNFFNRFWYIVYMVFYTIRFHHIPNCWLLYTFQTCSNINNHKTDNPFRFCLLIFAANVTDISPFCLHNQGSQWQNAPVFVWFYTKKCQKVGFILCCLQEKLWFFMIFPTQHIQNKKSHLNGYLAFTGKCTREWYKELHNYVKLCTITFICFI